MKIALDIDGVLYEWERTARFLIKTQWGIDLPESTQWYSIRDSVPAYVWKWLWTEGINQGLFRHGHLVKGSIDGVEALKKLGEVIIVTSRPGNATQDTLDWLAYHRFQPMAVHIVGPETPKSSIKADIYIDDSPEVLEDLWKNTDGLILVWDRPWNSSWHYDDKRIVRVYGWEGVKEWLEKQVTQDSTPS